MDLKEEVEAAVGAGIAHTALWSALIGVLRQQGLITRDLENVMFDAAITSVESAPGIEPALAMRARRVLELIASEMAGPPTGQD